MARRKPAENVPVVPEPDAPEAPEPTIESIASDIGASNAAIGMARAIVEARTVGGPVPLTDINRRPEDVADAQRIVREFIGL
jgi:hypothetical protein